MSLEQWLGNHWISRHETSRDEIERLLAIADRDIAQSQVDGLGPEWSFDIAYNAILQAATAALAAAGYQAERQNKHLRVLESLRFTLRLDTATVAMLDVFRRKRHVAVYEQIGAVTEAEAREAIGLAKDVFRKVEEFLLRKHPHLRT